MEAEVASRDEVGHRVPASGSWTSYLRAIAFSQPLAWAALTCLFAALPLFFIKHARLADPDIWWHMRTGEWIVQNHRIPHADPFSAATLGRPWVDYSWVFDLGSYWVVSQFDLSSIIWFEMLMRLAVTAVIFSTVRAMTPHFWKAVGLTALAMLAMAAALPPRPGTLTVLFFVFELLVLVLAQRKSDARWLWILPALFVLWANVHIEFVLGLLVLGVFCAEPVMGWLWSGTREPPAGLDGFQRQLWLAFFASCVATLVNPYGPRLFIDVFHYARDTKIYDIIVEFHAMHFRSLNDWAVLLLLMLACFALGRIRPLRTGWAVLLGWAAWMGFRSLREAWLVAVLSAVIIASSGEEEDPVPGKRFDISLATWSAVGGSIVVLLVIGAGVWSLTSQKLLRQVAATFPLGAVTYIHQNHLQGPMLNELSWGGFLIYAVPEIPVAMDGRTNVHPQEEILHALPLWNGEAGWQNRPELQKANLVIADHSWPLANLLRSDPRFRVAYEDSTAVLFEAVPAEKNDSPTVSQTR